MSNWRIEMSSGCIETANGRIEMASEHSRVLYKHSLPGISDFRDRIPRCNMPSTEAEYFNNILYILGHRAYSITNRNYKSPNTLHHVARAFPVHSENLQFLRNHTLSSRVVIIAKRLV